MSEFMGESMGKFVGESEGESVDVPSLILVAGLD